MQVDVREQGAKGDGIADDTDAFVRALDGCRGSGSLFDSRCWRLYVPCGKYRITRPLRLLSQHTGLVIEGDGLFSSMVQFEGQPGRYLWNHDEEVDGRSLSHVTFRDIGFHGAADTGWLYSRAIQGSGSFYADSVLTRGFATGVYLDGSSVTPAQNDIHLWQRWMVRDVKDVYVIANAQSVVHDFIGCDVASSAGGDVFRILAGGHVNVVGGSWMVFGNSFLHFPAGCHLGPDNYGFRFHSIRTELRGLSLLVWDEAPTVNKRVNFIGHNGSVVVGAPRKVGVLCEGCHLTFQAGSTLNGVFAQSARPEALNPPVLMVDSTCDWLNKFQRKVGEA
jgi:hypothetical protein